MNAIALQLLLVKILPLVIVTDLCFTSFTVFARDRDVLAFGWLRQL